LEPYDWRTREETDAVLALARTWQRPAAILRALDVVARDLAFRHGAFREAAERFEELLTTSRHYGSIPGQAEALLQLTACQLVLGEVALARHTAQRVREMVARLGSMHRLRVVIEVGLATGFAYYLDGDWQALATAATQFVESPEAAQSPLGLFVAANAANNHSRAGNLTEARRILSALLAVLPTMPPTMYVHNGTVNIAATSVWELGAVECAATCRELALDLIAAGIGGHFMGSHELTVARMAALLGDMAEASTYFARARTELAASGRRPLRAIVDYDEALALLRASPADPVRVSLLLDAALAQFRTLGMEAWRKRTLEQQEQLALRRRPTSSREQVYPDGLTSREVEVLRQFLELNFAPTDDPQRKARLVDQMASTPQQVGVSTWDGMFAWDSATATAACKVPVLYIDTGTPNADLQRFHELCPQLVIGKTVGSGHFLELEVPEQVNAMIDRFLVITLSPSTTTVQAGATAQTAQ
jgi:pimeloyl-ACP methyl ester carboxylesterase